MFEQILGIDILVALLLPVAWGIAGYLAGRLAFLRTQGRLQVGAWITLAVLGLTGLLVAAKLATSEQFWSYGWLFARDRVIVSLPLVILPAAATLLWSVPRLWRIAREAVIERRAKVGAAMREAASAPGLVVPIQATALGATLGAYGTLFPPGPELLRPSLVLAAIFTVGTAALWVRQRRRCQAMVQFDASMGRGLGTRLVGASAVVLALGVGIAAWSAYSMQTSVLPDRFSMMSHENVDYGGGPEVGHGSGHSHGRAPEFAHVHSHNHGHSRSDGQAVNVTDLREEDQGEPDRRFSVTAQKTRIKLSSGKAVEAWTFDGKAPGPELRVRQGDLVEVTLVNEDIELGVTIHWHGVDVPNAEDGVAGLTQGVVKPGESHTYRFRAEQTGTYWYHSHQVSSLQVRKGLFGTFVVEPREPVPEDLLDITVPAHTWFESEGDEVVGTGSLAYSMVTSLGDDDTLRRKAVSSGTPVRLRLINISGYNMTFTLTGTPFRVTAIDGADIHAPSSLEDARLELAAGGCYDVQFSMPDRAVRLAIAEDVNVSEPNPEVGLLLSRDGTGEVPPVVDGPRFKPSEYGSPKPAPFGTRSDFDREFVQVFDTRLGFYDGKFRPLWATNGEVFPNTPTLMVREGDLVKVTFVNRSLMEHPMHLHGHHVLVLSRNGQPVAGSPWWADTLNVEPGEMYEVAFRADNPGIWMDHCHVLDHAAEGMMMHLVYEGVVTPFEAGDPTGNRPE
jgi:FtsP/CotA-like multicopper oxidase with cupredoxin domain